MYALGWVLLVLSVVVLLVQYFVFKHRSGEYLVYAGVFTAVGAVMLLLSWGSVLDWIGLVLLVVGLLQALAAKSLKELSPA